MSRIAIDFVQLFQAKNSIFLQRLTGRTTAHPATCLLLESLDKSSTKENRPFRGRLMLDRQVWTHDPSPQEAPYP